MKLKTLTDLINHGVDKKLDDDTARRLRDNAPVHPGNDYELHLLARKLRLEGKDRKEVRAVLMTLVNHIPQDKRANYLADILDSILVGFCDNPLPAYIEEE